MDGPAAWARGRLPDGDGRVVSLDVNGLSLDCVVPAGEGEPEGATSFGLLAASLSACTAMSVRTFLQRWRVEPGEVEVEVAFRPGVAPTMDRRVTVEGEVGPDLREQLAGEVDNTPVTRLLRDALTIRTVLVTGGPPA